MYPVLFKFGPIGIYTYGLMMAAGFLAGLYVLRREYERRGFDPELASTVVLAAIIGGVVGAKLYYVAFYGDLGDLFSGSGLAWYGGFLGGTAAVLIVFYRDRRARELPAESSRKRRKGGPEPKGRVRLGDAVDPLGPALLIGQAFGRVGCFLSGDGDYGPPTDLPWGIAFPNATVPSIVDGTVYRVHPTMVYDVLLLVGGFLIVWSLRKRWDRRPGALLGLSFLLLAGERFITEFWRLTRVFAFNTTPLGWKSRSLADYVHGTAWQGRLLIDGISEFQIFSLLAMIAGGIILWQASKAARRRAAE